MNSIGEYQFMIDAYLSDFRGKATLPMIGGFMLKSATRHAEERGFGYTAMVDKNRAWVLSRMAIEIYIYPQNDSYMNIRTWVADVNKIFTERCFSFHDNRGNVIGYARSIWAAIDLETRRPGNILALEGLTDNINTQEDCPISGVKKILPIKNELPTDQFSVKYSDIDINKHLNSMKYIEHFLDIFEISMFKEKEICRFEINYQSECKYGETIDILKKEETENIYLLEMLQTSAIASSSRITWK